MPKFVNNVDLNQFELQNAKAHPLAAAPGSPGESQFYYNSTSKTLQFRTNSGWVILGRLDQTSAPTADVDLSSQKIINLATPTAAGDGVTKAYVDSLVQGLSWKDSVRVATTAAGTLASSFEDGDTVDGVTLATGNRILVKNQAAGEENGIYTVNASGAPTRATDADTAGDIYGAAVYVEEGSTNANTIWTLSTDATITLGTTALTFAQIGGGTTPTAGAGLTISSNTYDVGAGTGITVNANDVALTVPVSVANGGTNATDAATARTNLGAVTKYATDIGDGSTTAITVTHNLGTRDVEVSVRLAGSPYAEEYPDIAMTTTNTITVTFGTAPTSGQYRCTVIG